MHSQKVLSRPPRSVLLILLGVYLTAAGLRAADPVVSNVRATQRPGTQWVDISYDVADPDSDRLTVSVAVSDTGGATYAVPASSCTRDIGSAVTPGKNKRITWDAGKDWPGKFSANLRFKVTADDSGVGPPPIDMALIPAGSFQMGDTFDEGDSDEHPVHTVTVGAFYMDKYEVTKALWDDVMAWALANGYEFDNAGEGKGANHPVHSVNWYDVVRWCNARSEKEGRVPAYYTDAGLSGVYKTGWMDPYVRWNVGIGCRRRRSGNTRRGGD